MRFAIPSAALILLAACTSGNAQEAAPGGDGASRTFAVSGFDKVSLRGSDRVIVKVGGAESVSATGDSDVLDALEIEVRDGTLRVGRKPTKGFTMAAGVRGTAVVTVTLPRLAGASVAGSGDLDVDEAQGDSFDGAIAGSGNLRVARLTAETASFDIAGSGDLLAAGTARTLTVSIAGSGNVDAPELKSDRATISVAGSGGVKAGVDGSATVSIMGSGDVEITGNADCRVTKMGSGRVRCTG